MKVRGVAGQYVVDHGLAGTPEYRVWQSMRERCTNPRARRFADYGGRGITVCTAWDDFSVFLRDVGPRPNPQLTLDRIDNERGYEPGNVRWATRKEQALNRRKADRTHLRGQPHVESYKYKCQCGMVTNGGPMKRHTTKTGHVAQREGQ